MMSSEWVPDLVGLVSLKEDTEGTCHLPHNRIGQNLDWGLPHVQNCEKAHFSCWIHPVWGILL